MKILPIEVWQLILDLCPLISQFNLISCCKLFSKRLQIIDFYYIDDREKAKLTDQILKRYPHIKYLDASGEYCQVTNEGMVVKPPNI